MGHKGEYKLNIGDVIDSYERNLLIIDRKIVYKKAYKNGKQYNTGLRYYKYKCLSCGNEDWIVDYSLIGQKCGCNACCTPPKKIVKGINDISTTAPWMMQFIQDKEYCYSNAKNSKVKTKMICPDCGRVHIKTAAQLNANHGLACICKDGCSYPNKFMHSFLEQTSCDFEREKVFDWSQNRIYDFYISTVDGDAIIEVQGIQHIERCINAKSRSLEEEIENDVLKKSLALNNGIKYYYTIDASVSECDYIKNSIINSEIANVLHIDLCNIDWNKCDEFATSNLYKTICEYHETNKYLDAEEIAKNFKVSKMLVFRAIKTGIKFGWCTLSLKDSRDIREKDKVVDHGQKPVYCLTNDTMYSSALTACNVLSEQNGDTYNSRPLRKSIDRGQKYKGLKFTFVSRQDFNKAKSKFPEKCFGDFFNIKENTA